MADFKRTVSSNALDTTYIRREVVRALENNLVLSDFITPGDLPEGSGSTLRFIVDALVSGATATNALTNDAGTPITFATRFGFNEDTYAPTGINAQINTYGTFVPVRKKDLQQMPKGQMDNLARRMEYRGRDLMDILVRATVDGSGTGFGPSMGTGTTLTRKSIGDGTNNTTISAGDQLTAEDIALVTGDLWATNARPFSSSGQYAAIIHSVPATHLVTDVSTSRITWEEINKHVSGVSGQEKLLSGRIGAITGTMVARDNNITQTTVDIANVYNNIILSEDAVGAARMGDMNPDVIINPPIDPYNMFQSVAFVFDTRPVLLATATRAALLYSAP